MKFRMVEELAIEQQDVGHCCSGLKVSRSGYYEWLNRPQSAREIDNILLWEEIKLHSEKSRGTYGLPRIMDQLRKSKRTCGKNRVARIMKENGIQGVGKKKYKVTTTDSNHSLPIADRIFKTEIAPGAATLPTSRPMRAGCFLRFSSISLQEKLLVTRWTTIWRRN